MMIIGYGNITEDMINDYEKHIGFDLPDDYKYFLMQYNGGKIKDGVIFVGEIEEKIPLHVLYGLNVEKGLDLQKWNDEYQDDLLPNSIIIGHDYGGEFIVLINDPEKKGIYFWDHMFSFEQSNEEHNTYFIANSFQEFINELK